MEERDIIDDLGGDEEWARCVLDPRQNDDSGVFADERFLRFSDLNDAKKLSARAMSLAWCRKFATSEAIHEHGSRTAANANRAARDRKGEAFDESADTVHYLGYYTLEIRDILGHRIKDVSVSIQPSVEHGEDGHCNLCISPLEGVGKRQYSDARTTLFFALKKTLDGPYRYAHADSTAELPEKHYKRSA